MTKFLPIYLMLALLVTGAVSTSCNSDSKEKYSYSDPMRNSVMVSAFNLKADDSILTNLDSVYFTIDLEHSRIFNADSLPVGTKVDRLIPVITIPACRKAEITMPSSTGADTTVNYLTNSTDSIDFSRGYVKLHVVSIDEEVECTYTIYVNVHNMAPDSLAWGGAAWAPLPVASATATKAVSVGSDVCLFTRTASGTSRSTSSDLAGAAWSTESVTLPAGAVLDELTACGTTLYIIDSSNALYSSTDRGTTWTATGATMSHIYGAYQDMVAGVEPLSDGTYQHVTYPASTTSPVAEGCPVSGTSGAVVYTSEWSTSPMMITLGGRCADGSLTGSCWAFDGTSWAPSSITTLPGVEGAVMVPYFSFSLSSIWNLTKHSILLAMGGKNANGTVNKYVYLSYDRGVHWSLAPASMQLPLGISPLSGASAIVASSTFGSRATAAWHSIELPRLAPWYKVMEPSQSRATEPITEWDCPFIYLFGGTDRSGQFNDHIYRAVINRLMFKPIQ